MDKFEVWWISYLYGVIFERASAGVVLLRRPVTRKYYRITIIIII